MTPTPLTSMAEAQAASLCWLARQRGLPSVHALRMAVAQLHPAECGWCAWPLPELLALLGPVVERRDGPGVEARRAPGVTAADEREWRELPPRTRLAAVRAAQRTGEEPAA